MIIVRIIVGLILVALFPLIILPMIIGLKRNFYVDWLEWAIEGKIDRD